MVRKNTWKRQCPRQTTRLLTPRPLSHAPAASGPLASGPDGLALLRPGPVLTPSTPYCSPLSLPGAHHSSLRPSLTPVHHVHPALASYSSAHWSTPATCPRPQFPDTQLLCATCCPCIPANPSRTGPPHMSSSDAGVLLTCVAALPRASQPCWKVLVLYNPPNLRRLDYGHLQVTEQATPQF